MTRKVSRVSNDGNRSRADLRMRLPHCGEVGFLQAVTKIDSEHPLQPVGGIADMA